MTPIQLFHLLLNAILFTALIFASKEDLEHHTVSRKKQVIIVLACLPLIALNWQSLTYYHLIYAMVVFVLYWFGMGGADVKILIPLFLTLPTVPLIMFTILFNIFGLLHGYWLGGWSKIKGIPLIPSIAISYALVLLWIR